MIQIGKRYVVRGSVIRESNGRVTTVLAYIDDPAPFGYSLRQGPIWRVSDQFRNTLGGVDDLMPESLLHPIDDTGSSWDEIDAIWVPDALEECAC